RLGILSRPVLDVLGFVENDGVKLLRRILLPIATDERIAGDNQVAARNPGEQLVPAGAVQRNDLELRGEPGSFAHPVEDKRGGTYDERWQRRASPASACSQFQKRQRL